MTDKPTYEELQQRVKELENQIVEGKLTGEAQRESEERFRAIFETAKDSIFIKDRHLRYTLVNPTMEHLFGISASQLLGKSDEELFGDEAGAHIREIDSCVLRGEIVEEEDTKPVSGVPTTFHIIKVPIRDNSGEIIGLCGIARDITKQKQAKEALKKAHEELEQRVKERTVDLRKINDQLIQEIKERKSAEKDLRKYERMVAASDDHMSLTNRDYVYQVANDAYLRSHNVKREAIVGHSVPELFGKEFFETHQKPMIDRCLAGEVVRYQSWIDFPTLGRRYMDIAYYPYFEDDGSISGCVINARDITESKQVEKALRESEERYKSLFINNHSVMLLIDPESANIVDANPAAISFYGWRHEELARKKITDINTLTERQVFQEMKRAKTEQRRIFYFKHRLASGKIRDVEVYSGPIKVYGRELLYSIVHDITKRKQAELSLIERGKELENKSHELEEVNAALKVLLKHREEDKKEFEEKVIANVKKLVFPYLEKLYNSRLNDRQKVYLNIAKSNLEDIVAPFLRQLPLKFSDLTPGEIQVAGLVKDGKTTKEIADLLNSSAGAVNFHRNNIRKKLGLRNTKTNLRSFLLPLS
jgi:PAS domain S-box-containing protein